MPLSGKICAVFVWLMTFVFGSLAVCVYATHVNWRMAYDNADPGGRFKVKGMKQQVKDRVDANIKLREDLEKLKNDLANERAAFRFTHAIEQTKFDQYSEQLRIREREYTKLLSAQDIAKTLVNTSGTELATLRQEVEQLRSAILLVQQQRDVEFTEVVRLANQISDAIPRIEGAAFEEQKLNEQMSGVVRVMQHHDLTMQDATRKVVPTLFGVVQQVGDQNSLVISLGRDDGLREGHTLHVFRQSSYLGRMVVKQTEPRRSVGFLELRKGDVQVGDRVATKLKG